MTIRFRVCGVCCALIVYTALHAQGQTVSAENGSLEQSYNDAQTLQQAARLPEAVVQYRRFIAFALSSLADEYALAHDYAHAAPLFDEAIGLDPESSSIQLAYARTALTFGQLDLAETLATDFIRRHEKNREELAMGHQILGRTLLRLNRDQEARKEFETAVALDPTFPNGYDLAVACLDLGDEKCAAQVFAEMEQSFGDVPEVHEAFGRAYGESDFQSQAITEFRRAIEENPRLPGVHYLLAAVLLAAEGGEGTLTSAEAELQKELTISPHDAMTYTALGKIALTRNLNSVSENYLRQAISLDPHNPDPYLYLGQLYFNTDRMSDSEAALSKSIRLTTDAARNRYQVQKAHYLLGRILMKRGMQDAAHLEMQMSRELENRMLAQDKYKLSSLLDVHGSGKHQLEDTSTSPSSAGAAVDAGAMRNAEVLREKFRSAIADSFNNLGAIAATGQDYSQAATYFRQAAVWNPSLEGLDYNLGRAAFAANQYADAILPLSRYAAGHPDDTGARGVLGLSEFLAARFSDCVDVLKPLQGKSEMAPQLQYAYGESLIKSGDIKTGVKTLEALKKSHPEIAEVHRALGEASAREGNSQAALEELGAAIKINPNDAEAHYELGRMELRGRDTGAALVELEAAVRLSPDREEYHRELSNGYTTALRPADAKKELEMVEHLSKRSQSSASTQNESPPK